MQKITDEKIKQGLDKAYKEAGHNAYFGNGFEAGVRFAEDRYIVNLSEELTRFMRWQENQDIEQFDNQPKTISDYLKTI